MSKEKLYEFIAPATVPFVITVKALTRKEADDKVRRGDWESGEPNISKIEIEPDYFCKGLCEGYEEDENDWEDEE